MAASFLLGKLERGRPLSLSDYEELVRAYTPRLAEQVAERARGACEGVYGSAVFARGLVEYSNQCECNCLYCGIRRSNAACERFSLTTEQVLECAREGWRAGFRTFVLQGGQDASKDRWIADTVRALKEEFPACAVTLSAGERPREVYARWRAAGADRYLLRHETASPEHYRRLHPRSMTLEHRLSCLRDLRREGFAVGAGFMVGSPFQTSATLAADLKLVETLKPEMCGVGPFVPHGATAFRNHRTGSVGLTCYLVSLIRLMHPTVLLPATTALEALDGKGREKAILAGANVVMPNITPSKAQASYQLYNGKPVTDRTAFQQWAQLECRLAPLGRHLVVDRGDPATVDSVKKETFHG